MKKCLLITAILIIYSFGNFYAQNFLLGIKSGKTIQPYESSVSGMDLKLLLGVKISDLFNPETRIGFSQEERNFNSFDFSLLNRSYLFKNSKKAYLLWGFSLYQKLKEHGGFERSFVFFNWGIGYEISSLMFFELNSKFIIGNNKTTYIIYPLDNNNYKKIYYPSFDYFIKINLGFNFQL